MNSEISLKEVMSMLMRRWWIIIVCIILSGLIVFTITQIFIKPVYTSRGTIYVNGKTTDTTIDINDVNLALKLLNTYKQILRSDTFAKTVSEHLQGDYSSTKIKQMLKVVTNIDDQIIGISVSSVDKAEATLIVQTALDNASEGILNVIKSGYVAIVDNASLPMAPSSPNTKANVYLGMFIGLLIAIGLIVMLELLDITVKGEDDLIETYSFPVLGTIPHLKD